MIIVETQAVAPFFKNGFVVACSRTREAVLIDPGDEVDGLLTFARQESLAVRHILLTHAHIDHITGVAAAKRALNVPVYLHRDDLFLYDRAVQQGAMFGVRVDSPPPPVDVFYTANQVIRFGDFEVRPHHTPGHCPGGVCLQIGATGEPGMDLFVGDTLFAGSIGRTDLPGGDHATLLASIRTVLFGFGDEARVYPGHGPGDDHRPGAPDQSVPARVSRTIAGSILSTLGRESTKNLKVRPTRRSSEVVWFRVSVFSWQERRRDRS